MMQYIDYQQKQQRALNILAKMKESLDTYMKKDTYNEQWANERREMIIGLAQFMQSSERTIQELQTDTDDAFKRGFHKAKRQNEAPQQKFREVFTLFDALQLTEINRDILTRITKTIKTDELKRVVKLQATKKTWPELF